MPAAIPPLLHQAPHASRLPVFLSPLARPPTRRGSYLYFTGSRAFQQVMDTQHTFLHRQAIIARAGAEPLTDADWARIRRHGLGDSALGSVEAGDRAPDWLVKWTALVSGGRGQLGGSWYPLLAARLASYPLLPTLALHTQPTPTHPHARSASLLRRRRRI